MTKRVFRYFFDFTDGQEKWLNEMAAKGWRLIKCGQLSYQFESCKPGEYEYAVDFVAEKSYQKSKDYKAFLENIGYRTLYKNINVGIFIGKIKWRPWGDGAGQFTTAPGSLQKELLIVEKKKDGKPFELHTDLSDSLAKYEKIRTAYLWTAAGMFGLALMCLMFALLNTVYAAIAIPFCVAFGCLWLIPALKMSSKIRILKEEAKTSEYEIQPKRKKIIKIVAIAVVIAIFGGGMFWAILVGAGTINSGSALLLSESSGHSHWNASYSKLNGYRQRSISLDEGMHIISIEITTDSGKINLSIKNKDDIVYYTGSELPNSSFDVQVDGNDKIIIRIDAKDHSGSYKIKWE